MATPVRDDIVSHAPLDATGDFINGAEVDENSYIIADILDGAEAVALNSDAAAAMFFTALPYTIDHKIGRLKVYNDSGGAIADGDLLYVSAYDSGTGTYEVSKAITTTSKSTNLPAVLIADGAISNGASGYAVRRRALTAQDTSGTAVGDAVYLSTTAGGWTKTRHTTGQFIQVVGYVVEVHASTGRVMLEPEVTDELFYGSAGGTGLYLDADRDTSWFTSADDIAILQTDGTNRLGVDATGTIVVGNISSPAALATNATAGFLCITTSAGPPTGTPTAYTGKAQLHVDSTNNRLYYWNPTGTPAWRFKTFDNT